MDLSFPFFFFFFFFFFLLLLVAWKKAVPIFHALLLFCAHACGWSLGSKMDGLITFVFFLFFAHASG